MSVSVDESSAQLKSEDEKSKTFRKHSISGKENSMPPIDAPFPGMLSLVGSILDLSSAYVSTQPVCKVKRWDEKEKDMVGVSFLSIENEYHKYTSMIRELYRSTEVELGIK
ncbi:hypothetical protein T10_2342 [Trichinella papuae]|uniref:Uncharacterized protein n=1 Tax=Trichinella papuae TaxID=268474 RepID=A0A0V1M230_9BILA|nr:hypothetical protein T10_9236 [Trichinella papuae]KRZ80401.1 hypothetical protein T10_2342 [Trichinella papuae]